MHRKRPSIWRHRDLRLLIPALTISFPSAVSRHRRADCGGVRCQPAHDLPSPRAERCFGLL